MSKTTIDNFLNNTNPTNLHEVFANQINDFLSNKISFSEEELKIFTIKVLVMTNTLKQEYYNFLDNVSPEEMLHTIALYIAPHQTPELLAMAHKANFLLNFDTSNIELVELCSRITDIAFPKDANANELTKFILIHLRLEALCNKFMLNVPKTIFEEANIMYKQSYTNSFLQIENNEVKIVSSNINSNEDNDTSTTLDAIQNETVIHNTTASDTDILGHNHTEHSE